LQLARNGSAGGARPKLWIGLQKSRGALKLAAGGAHTPPGFTPWLLKLDVPAVNAPYREYGRIEHAYALMAAAAGLRSCATQLIESPDGSGQMRAHFAIARFDRGADNQRIHFHSLAGITESDFDGAIDYRELLSTTLNVCRDWQEGLEALRRAIFNVAARVRDDHAKNHGFLLDPVVGWRLSPAYDLVYASPARFPRHAMSVTGNAFDPGISELLRLAEEAEIPTNDARGAIESVKAAIAQWPKFAEQAGISRARAGEISVNLPGRTW
jgi:serine/threonine-protein kinase HipA